MLRAIDREDLLTDPRFAARDDRVAHADELHALIGDWIAERTNDDALAGLNAAGVGAAPVRDTAAAVRDPLLLERGEVVPLAPGVYGSGMPFRLSDSDTSLDRPAPTLGQDTDHLLTELLGYGRDTLIAPRESAII